MDSEAHPDVTELLAAADRGDRAASDRLLPLVYDELRKLARHRLHHEPPGQTLQATALVHEAYLRLVGDPQVRWANRRHFFGAAALAMRRIVVERARRKGRLKHGGGRQRCDLQALDLSAEAPAEDLTALDEALTRLENRDKRKSEVVMLRFFAGLTIEQTAEVLGISAATVKNEWSFAKAWLFHEITDHEL
ncbi:MAG: ECF-type sigma factor [Phycisphaerae bacterium]